VSCQRGDIFCRECALANILAQKKELKRAEKIRQDAEREAALGDEEREEEDRVRAVKDFEMTQAGLLDAPNSNKSQSQSQSAEARPPRMMIEPSKPPDGTNTATELVLVNNSNGTGIKRKFELDETELERTARADKIRARKAIEDEKVL
jgi:nitric oxide synthase-interacting protein